MSDDNEAALALRSKIKDALWDSILNLVDGAGSDLAQAEPDSERVFIALSGCLDVEQLASEVMVVLEREAQLFEVGQTLEELVAEGLLERVPDEPTKTIDITYLTEPVGPFWAYPTTEAKLAHYFGGMGQASGCRRYWASAAKLMTVLERQPAESACCIVCERKAQRANG